MRSMGSPARNSKGRPGRPDRVCRQRHADQ
jgi:hypothetical protein